MIEHALKAVMNLCERIEVLAFEEKIAEGRPDETAKNWLVIDAYLGE